MEVVGAPDQLVRQPLAHSAFRAAVAGEPIGLVRQLLFNIFYDCFYLKIDIF